jgi:hypothetical protein
MGVNGIDGTRNIRSRLLDHGGRCADDTSAWTEICILPTLLARTGKLSDAGQAQVDPACTYLLLL